MSYGDIMRVETTGASWATSQLNKLGYSVCFRSMGLQTVILWNTMNSVSSSHTMAKADADEMEKYRSKINSAGHKYGIDPALIAAIISRESRAGEKLIDGWGDNSKAWGLMQVDVTPTGGGHKKVGAWDSEEHLCQATGILVYFIKKIRDKFPGWNREQQLKGGIAAYNKGDGNVHSYENVDACTTDRDYSNDVVARAQWYKNNKGY